MPNPRAPARRPLPRSSVRINVPTAIQMGASTTGAPHGTPEPSRVGRLSALWTLATGALLLLLIACSPPRDAEASRLDASARMLEGQWLLTEFHPELPLEPMLADMLAAELKQLVVAVDGQEVTASGRAVQLRGRYVVLDEFEGSLRVGVAGEPGVVTHFQVRRVGDELTFRCQDAPWRGVGTLALVPEDDAREEDEGQEREELRPAAPARFTKVPNSGAE